MQPPLAASNARTFPPDIGSFNMSDNVTLAKKGVPAHTISTSQMDKEPHYHTPDDEWDKLDYNNMNAVIKAIAASAKTIINGKDTPKRIDVNKLKR